MNRWSLALVGIAVAALISVACGSGASNRATPTPDVSPTGFALETPNPGFRTPSPSLLAPRDEWLAAPSTPPATCAVSTPQPVRAGVAPGISLGPVHFVGTPDGTVDVDLVRPLYKMLIVVDQAAGANVAIEGRQRVTGTPLLFYYDVGSQSGANVPADELGVSRLALVGPFDVQQDAARGYFFAREPGCYNLTARWDGGSAVATLYFDALAGS